MSDRNNSSEIIKEFLDIWQKQFAYISKDPEAVTYMLKNFQSMQENFVNSFKKKNYAESNSASDLFRDANDELCKLNERIAGLEARVAELESGVGKGSKKTAGTNQEKESA